MGDFDFDELDKAVTGAISTKDNDSNETAPREKEVPAARRGSGRFMDVVHPSSDMRVKQKRATFTAPDRAAEAESTTPENQQEAARPEQSEPVQPLESPFLADAKVEKRPLGAFSAEEAVVEHLQEEPEDPLLEAPDDPLLEATNQPDPIDFELNRTASASKEETAYETSVEAPVESALEPTFEPTDEFQGAASITQQYTEQTSSAPASGAIYDTEAYHQPVAAPAPKKGSGILVFVWILLLIALGAGAGVAFYLFVLPLF